MLFLITAAFAQSPEPAPAPAVRYESETHHDFTEALELHGEILKPAGKLVTPRRSADFPPFFQLRKHFNDEITQSVDEVR